MTQKITLLLLLLFCFTAGQAQKSLKKKDDVEIIEFEDDTPKKSKSRKKSKKRRKSSTPLAGAIVKVNPFSSIVGWQFVEVEYPLKDFMSAQVGVGVTFRPAVVSYYDVLVSELLNPLEASPQWGSNDVSDNYYDNSIRNYGVGFYGSLSTRFFVYNGAPDGPFLSLKGRLSTRNIDVEKISEGAQSLTRLTDQFEKENIRHIDFMFAYGYQQLFDRMTIEYSIGLGYRIAAETRQDIGSDNSGRFYNGTRTINRNALRYEFGFRIGYQL